MTPDTVLTLHDAQTGMYFNFAQFEIPAEISLGGEQVLATHKMIGGARQVDSMGKDDAPIEWSGMFIGEKADERARYIDGLRVAGRKLTLTWHQFNFAVVIRSFHYKFQRAYRLPYSIAFEIAEDNTNPVRSVVAESVDAALASDMLQVQSLGAAIADPALTQKLSAMQTAMKAVSTIANASTAVINSIVTPIQDAQRQVTMLTSAISNTVGNVATLGGATAGGQTLLGSASSFGQMNNLFTLNGLLNRMLKNVRNAPHA